MSRTRVVAIANQKGGVGKTTTAVNLSACLAEKRHRILLIDLDPQANATSGLGFDKEEGGSIYDALLGEGRLADRIRPSGLDRLDLVPAEVDLAGAEIDVARSDHYLHRFRQTLDPVREQDQYEFIIVDCPPSLGILTMNALTAAHSVLITLQCEYYALEGLSVIKRLVQQLRESGANPALEIEGILMTMYDMRTNLSRDVVQDVCEHLPDEVFDTLIPRSVRLSEAPSFGQPIIQYEPNSTGAAAYRRAAREFLARQRRRTAAAPPDAPPPDADPAPPALGES